ncbi:MAG TPA: sorbosone dehydrogenase family protein [Sphingomonadaceae bacterium]
MRILKKILIVVAVLVVILIALGWWFTRGVPADYSVADVTGADPKLHAPDSQVIPTVAIAKPVGWKADQAPTPAAGLKVNRFAAGLDHPRVIYTLPNGDVLVAESNAPARVVAGGSWLTNLVAKYLFSAAGAAEPSPDKIVLLRDADGDGVAETSHVLRAHLSSPSGMAWRDGKLYVADHDALLQFDYQLGALAITGEPRKLMDLPPAGNHWMRNILLSPDGTKLYIAVGSSSNIADAGMDAEKNRAAIHEYDIASGSHREYAGGLRNPNGLAWNPWSGELWVTVNERDQLGSDLVPDYLTNVPVGAQYGWPWVYWGNKIDERVNWPMPNFLIDYTRRPEFALGPHVAALGLAFTQGGSRMSAAFAQGAFIARHGSWNRKPPSGYDVVFVKFDTRGNPLGKPVPVLTGFLNPDGTTKGRPTWVAWDKTGALLVSDDTGNIVWRVLDPNAAPAPAPKLNEAGGSLPPLKRLQGNPLLPPVSNPLGAP